MTKIEWCEETWNPLAGCSRVSKGCEHCYAEIMANRLQAIGIKGYDGVIKNNKWTGKINLLPDKLDQPLHWKKPRRIFVNSMSDLFHENVPDSFIQQVLYRINHSPNHIFYILTKRPLRLLDTVNVQLPLLSVAPIKNLWLGVSVEDQQTADERKPILLQTPAAKRFISIEPMLGEIDLSPADPETGLRYNYLTGVFDGNNSIGNKIDWVILGCESGPNARPMNIEWARKIKNQCIEAGIPFFFKQAIIDGKMIKLPTLDGKQWKEFPIWQPASKN